ncbi:KAP family P-loop NTPase fold protein [Frondihabitans peucedani]|uniref:KAP NTPase domain-containing protein n=1 Tax=Frondihabitans peucedani TaxID=598626 RepID=A0ABP8E1E3_9MICO
MDVDLQRSARARRYAEELLNQIATSNSPRTFALIGPWGSGKTWLLEELLSDVQNLPGWIGDHHVIARFEPWYFSDEQSLFAGFASFLLQQTLKKGRARKRAAKLLEFVGPALKFPAIDLAEAANKASTALGGSSAPQAIRAAVKKGLEDAERHVVVVMDDLDRLNPDELLMLFKLIRLVGDIPRLHYVLAYDEETLFHLLSQTPIASNSSERARRYLEKLVDRRWEVPELTSRQVDDLVINRLPFPDAFENPQDPGVGYRLAVLIYQTVKTPRAAQRLLDTALAVPQSILEELHPQDLYFSLWLRTFAPDLWNIIKQEADLLVGNRTSVFSFSDDSRKADAERLLKRLREAATMIPAGTEAIDLLLDTFPAFNRLVVVNASRTSVKPPRFGNSDSVDKYFWLEVPPDAVSDLEVRALVRELPATRASDRLSELLNHAPRLLLGAIRGALEKDSSVRAVVFAYLETIYKQPGIANGAGLFGSVDSLIKSVAEDIVKSASESELRVIEARDDDLGKRRLFIVVVTDLLREKYLPEGHVKEWARELKPKIVASLEQAIGEQAERPALNGENITMLLRVDHAAAQQVAIESIRRGVWNGVDLAEMYVTRTGDAEESGRVYFHPRAVRSHWDDEVQALMLRDASGIDIPEQWLLDGPPLVLSGSAFEQARRFIAAFSLCHPEAARMIDADRDDD